MTKVICPNCGGENNVIKNNGQECAYCGTMLEFPKSSTVKKTQSSNSFSEKVFEVWFPPKYKIDEEVVKALQDFLVGAADVPVDIFDYLEVKSIKRMYLPMWRFCGSIDTEWSCDEIVYRKRKIGEKAEYDRRGNFKGMKDVFETYEDYVPKFGHGHCPFDILVPAIEKTKEDLPYCTSDFSELDLKTINEIEDINKLDGPLKPTRNADANSVIHDVTLEIEYKADTCSYGSIRPRTHEHMTYSYTHDNGSNVCELYYVPFVYVIYGYNGETYEWGFKQKPKNCGDYETPKSNDTSVDEQVEVNEQKWKKLEFNYYLFFGLSFIFGIFVGAIIFFIANFSLFDKLEKRYKRQNSWLRLIDKLRRKEQLAKRGRDTSKLNDEIMDGYEDDEDDITPKTVAEVQSYFAETESLTQKFKKRMQRFWAWYFAIIIILGTSIGGYLYWEEQENNKKVLTEVQQKSEEKRQATIHLENVIREAFFEHFVGKTFIGSLLNETPSGNIRIVNSLNTPKLEISFINDKELRCNGGVYTYTLIITPNIEWSYRSQELKAKPTCEVNWGNYKMNDILDYSYELSLTADDIPLKFHPKVIHGEDVFLMTPTYN